eukprot:TRINITY_DN31152_c0_g1_i1.p1 TRINITY_DN31152_c0_g1~~TRINITY_DN31152_c0_g1_i1.p1  ORF type:complete len:133 (+),score=12.04 TRINITY_DN31152_c0_g1_i1:39-437(+)
MIAIAIIAILAAILIPSFKKARAKSQLATCTQNCRSLATALEMYAVDFDGRYPDLSGLAGLGMLTVGNYMRRLPSCPCKDQCTFVDYVSQSTPDKFSFSCVGNQHGEVFAGLGLPSLNIPAYTAEGGVVDHP